MKISKATMEISINIFQEGRIIAVGLGLKRMKVRIDTCHHSARGLSHSIKRESSFEKLKVSKNNEFILSIN